jgi:AcrR family transcriptional regulator
VPYRRTPAIQARLDAQRHALITAAVDLLSSDGYAGCSIAAVAGRAGVAAGTVYRHFENKGELAAEVFRVVVGRELDAVRAAVAAESEALGRIRAVIETFAGRALKSPQLAYALLAEPVDPVVDALRLEFRTAFRDIVAAAIADGIASGELPPQNAPIVAAALVGAIGEALVGPLANRTEDPETVPTLIRFADRALGAVHVPHA